jgi:hypothetical protein
MDGRRLFPAEKLRSCDHLEPSEWYQAREVFTWFYPSVAIIFIIITINAFPKFMRPQKDRKPQIDDSNRLISSERFGPPGNASHGAPKIWPVLFSLHHGSHGATVQAGLSF